MKNGRTSKLLSLLLAIVMVFGMLPISALADETTTTTSTVASKVESWSLTLADDISVNFKMSIDPSETDATVKIVTGENTQTWAANEASGLLKVSLAAAQMMDDVVVSIVKGDGTETVLNTYSVRKYADYILENSDCNITKNLVLAMLNYGAKAQELFDYKTETLANSGLNFTVVEPENNPEEIVVEDNLQGISFYGASLLAKDKVVIRYYFTVTGDVNSYNFTVAGNELETTAKDGLYYVDIEGLAPDAYDTDVTVSVSDTAETGSLNVTYSVDRYIKRMYYKDSTSDETKAWVAAMHNYNLAAIEYVALQNRIAAEDPTPAYATLVENYVNPVTANQMTWGGDIGNRIAQWMDSYDGKANVMAYGTQSNAIAYLGTSFVMGEFNDPSKYMVIRMWVDSSVRALWLLAGGVNVDYTVIEGGVDIPRGQWTNVVVPMSALIGDKSSDIIYLKIATGAKAGTTVYVDQVYMMDGEQAVPEGATLVEPYLKPVTANQMTWGGDVENRIAQWSESFEGKSFVMSYGNKASATAYVGTSFVNGTFNDPSKNLVVRMWVDPSVRALWLMAGGVNVDYAVIEPNVADITRGQWVDVVVPMEKLIGTSSSEWLYVKIATGAVGATVHIDQVYMLDGELAIPEGATFFSDYSKAHTPWVNPNYGNHNAVYNWYSSYEGRAGVMALGAPSASRAFNWVTLGDAMQIPDGDGVNLVTRVYVTKKPLQFIYYAETTHAEYDISSQLVAGQWNEISFDLSELYKKDPGTISGLHLKYCTEAAGESIFIDQIYVTTANKPVPDYTKRSNTEMDIWGYWAPKFDEQQYTWLAESGINKLVLQVNDGAGTDMTADSSAMPSILRVCESLGIDAYIALGKGELTAENIGSIDEPGSLVRQYGWLLDYPALKGAYIDEPEWNQVDAVAQYAKVFQSVYGDRLELRVNMYPGSNYSDYESDIATYVEKVLPYTNTPAVSFDIYPLLTDGLNEKFFMNLEINANLAKNNGMEFHSYIATQGIGSTRRTPSEADIRFTALAALAYGASEIKAFCYKTPGDDGEFDANDYAMIGLDNQKTEQYAKAQAVFKELHALNGVYSAFDWQGVMTSGSCANFNYLQKSLSSYSGISAFSSTNEALLGCFKSQDELFDGYMLVNAVDPLTNKSNTVTLTFAGARYVQVYKGLSSEVVALTDNTYTVTLAAGEGAFIVPFAGNVNTYSVNVTGGSANATAAAFGDIVTLTADAAAEGKVFDHWTVNGTAINGNSFAMCDDVANVVAVYVDAEPALPEGAILYTDYSIYTDPYNHNNWGNRNLHWEKIENFQGRNDVMGFGSTADGTNYNIFSIRATNQLPASVLESIDAMENKSFYLDVYLTDAVSSFGLTFDALLDSAYSVPLGDVARNQWVTLEVPFSALSEFYNGDTYGVPFVQLCSTVAGTQLYIDRIYVDEATPVILEDAIPEGAVMLEDYEGGYTVHPNTNWGASGNVAYSLHGVYEGKANVMAYGSTNASAIDYVSMSIAGGTMNDANKNLVMRVWATDSLRAMWLFAGGVNADYEVHLPGNETIPAGQWYDLVIPMKNIIGTGSSEILYLKLSTFNANPALYIDQIYLVEADEEPVPDELAIPEGATLITDLGTSFTAWVNPNYGNHNMVVGTDINWYPVFQGRAGVLGLGCPVSSNSWNHISLPGSVSEVDAYGRELVIRYYATRKPLNFFAYGVGTKDVVVEIPVSEFKVNEWAELRVDLTKFFENQADTQRLTGLHIRVGTNASGEFLYIDQAFITGAQEPPPEELPIPEQATLYTDYSEAWTPWVKPDWGNHDLTYQWYSEFEGRAGVMGYGGKVDSNQWNWLSLADNMNIVDAEGKFAVIRLYATQPILTLGLWATGTNVATEISVANIPTNEWYELRVDLTPIIGDGVATGLHLQLGTNKAGQTVFIDSIYIIEEVERPEGSVLICDLSEPFTPWINPNWGSHNMVAGTDTKWYGEFEGRSGVLGVGCPSSSNAWNHFNLPGSVSETDSEGKTLVIRYYATRKPLNFFAYGVGTKDVVVEIPVSEFKVNEWAELRVDLTKFFENQADTQRFTGLHIRVGTNAAGEFLYIDQAYIEIDESVVWQTGSFGGTDVTHKINTIGSDFQNRITVSSDAAKLYIRDSALDSYNVGDRVKVSFKLYSDVEAGTYSTLAVADENKAFDGTYIGGQWYDVNYFASVASDANGKYVELGLNDANGQTLYLRDIAFSADALPAQLFGGVTVEMVAHTNDSDAQMQGFLMTDGEYVLAMDSGYPTDDDHFYDELVKMASDAHVDGWFISHGHDDHYGALNELLKDDKVTIGTLYFHFPDATDRNGKTENLAMQNEFEAIVQTRLAEGKIGSVVEIGKGGVYTYGDMTIKTLNDPYWDSVNNFLNDSTVVMKLETPGENLLFLGDLGTYGDTLLTDAEFAAEIADCSVVQMAHHGQNGTTQTFYNACTGMKMALYCAPDWLWNNDNGNGVNSGSWQTMVVRGWLRDMGVGVSYYLDGTDLILD